jgi:CubicO group peptidase (beta-lactamase class C family)
MESIEQFVLEQLAAWEVPGCAVAAVQDGDVVMAAGWGQRDLDAKLPVTSDTLFAIGSVTKAFTAATVGALVDDGLLEWERPLRDCLPELRLYDPVVTDRLTVVDLLSHRSGLPRHDLVWLGHPDRSRADLVRRLRFLPLSKDLRQAFQYCNLGYLAAGYAVEVLSGTRWEDFLSTRLLIPLGMGRSDLSVGDMTADPDHATAYERRQGVVVRVPQRPVTAMAPAGAVNSCAADMVRWLLAQLGGGQADGRAIMSSAGEYEHPGYGTLEIAVEGGTLRPRLGTLDLSMTHRHYETFDLEWYELGDQSHLFPLMFLSDPDGNITALTVPFEPSIEPQRFGRLPDARAQDPEVLRLLCGTYAMGPIEVVVALRGERVLTVAIPGAPPFELQPLGRGLRFELTGQPGVTAEFELDDTGAVTRLVAQPLGIFVPKT